MQEKKGPSGLLIGLIIGGAVGALVSTKKGRQILKDMVGYGFDYIGKTIDMEDIESILNGDEQEMPPFAEPTESKMEGEKDSKPHPLAHTSDSNHHQKNNETTEPSRRRRLFRGIGKK